MGRRAGCCANDAQVSRNCAARGRHALMFGANPAAMHLGQRRSSPVHASTAFPAIQMIMFLARSQPTPASERAPRPARTSENRRVPPASSGAPLGPDSACEPARGEAHPLRDDEPRPRSRRRIRRCEAGQAREASGYDRRARASRRGDRTCSNIGQEHGTLLPVPERLLGKKGDGDVVSVARRPRDARTEGAARLGHGEARRWARPVHERAQ